MSDRLSKLAQKFKAKIAQSSARQGLTGLNDIIEGCFVSKGAKTGAPLAPEVSREVAQALKVAVPSMQKCWAEVGQTFWMMTYRSHAIPPKKAQDFNVADKNVAAINSAGILTNLMQYCLEKDSEVEARMKSSFPQMQTIFSTLLRSLS